MRPLLAYAALSLALLSGCWFSSTKVTVQVLEHRQDPGQDHYAILYRVLEPKDLSGRYGIAGTRRRDLVERADNRDYEVTLNFTEIGTLTANRPTSFSISAPSANSDFLEVARPVG